MSIDRFMQFPSEGWPLWMLRQIDGADHVFVVFSERYNYRCLGTETPGFGKGVAWESTIMLNELQSNPHFNEKFIPILFDQSDASWIISPMNGFSKYLIQSLELDHDGGYHDLFRLITKQPAVTPADLGPIRKLPPLPKLEEVRQSETATKGFSRTYPLLLRSDGTLQLTDLHERRLYGIIRNVWQQHPSWVKTSVALAMQNLFLDRDLPTDHVANILIHLTNLPQPLTEPFDPTSIPLLHFAILLCEIAKKKGHSELSRELGQWLDDILLGTGYDWLAVAGRTVPLPKECLWAPSVEIAWNPTTLNRFPEVFVRWAGLRQRIEIPASTASRRIQATLACELIESNPRYSGIDIDHVEVSVDMESISLPWELKNESSVDDEEPKRPKWPVTVRLCKSCGPASRVEHDGMILDEATIQSSLDEDELIAISATQAFTFAFEHVDSVGPSSALRVAVNKFSAVLWSRKPIAPDRHTLVKSTLHGKTIYDLPKVIHRARFDCSKTSIWRQMVLFYDPNLPPFEFSVTDDDQDQEMLLTYQEINRALN